MARHRVSSPRRDRRIFRMTYDRTNSLNFVKNSPRGGIRL